MDAFFVGFILKIVILVVLYIYHYTILNFTKIQMKKLLYFLPLVLFINCEPKIGIPENSKLVARYTVFDEYISPRLNVCPGDTIPAFSDNSHDCLFRLDTLLFETEFRIGLNDEGNMKTLDMHSVTKNIDYERFGLEKDTTNWDTANGKDFWIRLPKQRDKIIDGIDTLEIERIFPNEKLIFVERRNEKKGRRFIYQYELLTRSRVSKDGGAKH